MKSSPASARWWWSWCPEGACGGEGGEAEHGRAEPPAARGRGGRLPPGADIGCGVSDVGHGIAFLSCAPAGCHAHYPRHFRCLLEKNYLSPGSRFTCPLDPVIYAWCFRPGCYHAATDAGHVHHRETKECGPPPQVIAVPVEGDLQDRVHEVQRRRAGNLEPPPDRRLRAVQTHLDPVHGSGGILR